MRYTFLKWTTKQEDKEEGLCGVYRRLQLPPRVSWPTCTIKYVQLLSGSLSSGGILGASKAMTTSLHFPNPSSVWCMVGWICVWQRRSSSPVSLMKNLSKPPTGSKKLSRLTSGIGSRLSWLYWLVWLVFILKARTGSSKSHPERDFQTSIDKRPCVQYYLQK